MSTNEAERQLALAKYNELHDACIQNTTRSKSKSPRRSRPHPEEPLPLPPVIHDNANSSSTPYGKGKARSRRPHTSAGPRDKPTNFTGGEYVRPHDQEDQSSSNISGEDMPAGSGSKRRSELRPESRDSLAKQPRIDGWKPNFWPTTLASSISPKVIKGATSSESTTASSSSLSSPEEDPGHIGLMREWGGELTKIEKKSRKTSDLLGFFKRKS